MALVAASDVTDAFDHLSELPLPLLVGVLLRLDAASLLRLGLCSRSLAQSVAAAEEAWQALCEARGWELCAAQASWRALFLHRRSRLCCDCGVATPYVFPLLGCRLCERCEANPRYALLTAAQALEAFSVTPEQLATLPCKQLRGLLSPAEEKRLRASGQASLYLRAHVAELAAAARRQLTARPSRVAPEEQFAFDEDSDASEGEAAASSSDDGDTQRRRHKPSAEEAKAARKAAKAAVKAANRERRATKSNGTSGQDRHSRSAGASPLLQRVQLDSGRVLVASAAAATQQRKAAHKAASRARSFGSSPPAGQGPRSRALVEDALGEFAISGLELCI